MNTTEPTARHLIDGLYFERISDACPEQYEVWRADDDRPDRTAPRGYVRLRHGRLTAEIPRPWGGVVYRRTNAHGDIGDGVFVDDATRTHHLDAIAQAINARWAARRASPPSPDTATHSCKPHGPARRAPPGANT